MGKCIYCGCDTNQEVMLYDSDDMQEKGELKCRYCCDNCLEDKIRKEQEKFKPKYEAFIKYLKDNNYIIKCESFKIKDYSCKKKIEYFNVTDELEKYVDTIRNRMKRKHYHEIWIDPRCLEYNNEIFEFIEYLCFENNKGYERRFYFELVDDNGNEYEDIKIV